MTVNRADIEAELILIAFADTCPDATEADVEAWIARFPAFASVIAAKADLMRCDSVEDQGSDGQIDRILAVERKRRDEAFLKAKAALKASKAIPPFPKWDRER